MRPDHTPFEIDRRTLLKWLGGGAMALAGWAGGVGAAVRKRSLIAVSSAGDNKAGVAPSVSLIDAASYDVLATVPLNGIYSFPATRWDPARDLIWSGVPAGGDNAVIAFRLSTGRRVASISTGSSQNYTELTPDGGHVIVAARFVDRYFKIGADPDTADFGKVTATLDTYDGAHPCDITVSADGRFGYAPDRGGDTITTIDLRKFSIASQQQVKRTQTGPLEPYMATVSPTNNVLLVENAVVKGGSATGSESIFDLSDPARPREVARLSAVDGLGHGPIDCQFTADGRYGIVVCRDSSSLSVIDTRTTKVVETIQFPTGSNPLTGTFDYADAGHTFFVPLPGRDAVAAVKTPAFEIERMIPVGPRPLGAVFIKAPVPKHTADGVPLGAALAAGRTFAADCPDPCCGAI